MSAAAALVRWRLYIHAVYDDGNLPPPPPPPARLPSLRGPQSTYVLFDNFNFQKTENTGIFLSTPTIENAQILKSD